MPFLFQLPTTSSLSFSSTFTSSTHASLPQAATTQRNILRSVLKKHKRFSPQSKASGLSIVTSALNEYIPYLLALDAGLSGRSVGDEHVDISLRKEVEVEWRSTLASAIPGREPPRVKGKGLHYELDFVLAALAYTHVLQARAQLHSLFASTMPTTDQRPQIIQIATKQLLSANSLHDYLSNRAVETDASHAVVETLSQTHSALAALATAEATLLAVLKDDPYPFVIAQSRNKDDKDWMIKPPEIPKVRAHLFARLCLAASEHAGRAEAGLSATGRVDGDLLAYVKDLRRTARAKACRFFGIDAELGGETGKGIAWLCGARKVLGFAGKGDEGAGKLAGLKRLKKDWSEKREDKRVEKGGEWGGDAGRLEELRVIEYLEAKWMKMNDTVGFHPPSRFNRVSHTVVDQHSTDTAIRSTYCKYALWQGHPFCQTMAATVFGRRHTFPLERTTREDHSGRH